MDSYLDGGEVAPILIAMSAQDIVSCLDALFGDVKLTTTGGIGLYTFFSQLNNNESSYLSYIHLALGGVEDEISDKIKKIQERRSLYKQLYSIRKSSK